MVAQFILALNPDEARKDALICMYLLFQMKDNLSY